MTDSNITSINFPIVPDINPGQLTDSHPVDISNVPQGVYILSILTDGKITTERIVKM